MASSDNGISFLTGFLLGGALGVAIGVLVAPKSGAETREELMVKSEMLRQRAGEFAGQVSDNITPTVDNLRSQGASAVGAVRKRIGMEDEGVAADGGQQAAAGS